MVSSENDDFAHRMIDRRGSAEYHHSQADSRRVSKSISIKKPIMLRPLDTDSPMNSPGIYGSSPPASPSLASPSLASPSSASPSPSIFREKDRRWRSMFHPEGREMSRSCSAKFEHVPPPNSPTVYDWVVISSLDR
uniref:Uncharacterized protein n=1 Tax=Physcomitrium patens TaxID=3218 RepID=A0A7I4CDS5_PHYPA